MPDVSAAPALRRSRRTAARSSRSWSRSQARRDLQPRRPEPRARQLRRPRIHGVDRRGSARCGCSRRCATLGGACRLLPGVVVSEMFGKVAKPPQNETTPFQPRSPYACAKASRTSSARTTARPTACTSRAASCSTTRAPRRGETVRDAQDHARGRAHQARARRRSSSSATSTRSATGASPATTSRRCG